MYIGHAAFALYARSRRPRLSLALLIPAAFLADWVQWILDGFGFTDPALSHSILAVAAEATLVALAYRVITRVGRAEILVLWLVVLSHWPADFLTASKPTWPGGPLVGLDLYAHGVSDFAVEFALLVVCWMAYVASVPGAPQRRSVTWLAPVGLALMQVAFLTLATHLTI